MGVIYTMVMTVLTTQVEVDEALTDPTIEELNIVVPAGEIITLGADSWAKLVNVSGPGQVIVDGGRIQRVTDGGNATVQEGGYVVEVAAGGRVNSVAQRGVVEMVGQSGVVHTVGKGGRVRYLGKDAVVNTVGAGSAVMECEGRVEYVGQGGEVHNVMDGVWCMCCVGWGVLGGCGVFVGLGLFFRERGTGL